MLNEYAVTVPIIKSVGDMVIWKSTSFGRFQICRKKLWHYNTVVAETDLLNIEKKLLIYKIQHWQKVFDILFCSITPTNLGQLSKPVTVPESAHPEDYKTVPDNKIWPRFSSDNQG